MVLPLEHDQRQELGGTSEQVQAHTRFDIRKEQPDRDEQQVPPSGRRRNAGRQFQERRQHTDPDRFMLPVSVRNAEQSTDLSAARAARMFDRYHR